MQDTRPVRRADVTRWQLALERALVAAGVALLGYVGYVIADARIAQQRAREALALAAPPVRVEPSTSRPVNLARGAAIGALSIPRVHLDAVVLHGSDVRTLRRGPGHIEDTALPGQPGNVAIAGHRDTFFRQIRDVREGDDVFIDAREGRYAYRVTSVSIVDPHDLRVLRPTTAPMLTLITCYPFWVAGPAPDRFVVRATEVSRPGESVGAAVTATSATTLSDPTAATMTAERHRVVDEPREPPPPATVHEAIERFRRSYNARAARHGQPTSALVLGSCVIATDAVTTTARCPDRSIAASAREWSFRLRYDAPGWHIVSVEPR